MTKAPEILTSEYRRNIRYIMFRLKSNNMKDLSPSQEALLEPVRDYYSSLPEFEGWDKFSDTWDIGTDDANVLHNWDDPSRTDKWWTWGISKFKIVKRITMTYAINTDEGITKSFPGVMDYFVALGYAKPDGKGGFRLDVPKIVNEVSNRDEWLPYVETDFSLKDAKIWQQHYYKNDTILFEKEK